jgi:hypothetical protein
MSDKIEKKLHKVRSFFIGLGLFVLFWIAVGMYLLGHTPKTYQPIAAPPQGEVSPYLTHKLGPDFFNNVQLDKPFELIVEQNGLNEIIASQCPEPVGYGGFTFSAAAITFTDAEVSLMSTVGFKDASTVLSVRAAPAMDAAGRLNLNIRSVKLGAIPVTGLAKMLAQKYADEYLIPSDPNLAPVVYGVLNNQPFEPAGNISQYKVRLKEFTLAPGKMTLLIEPEREKGR